MEEGKVLIAVQFDSERSNEKESFTNPTFHHVDPDLISTLVNFLTRATNKRVRLTRPDKCDKEEVARRSATYYNP